MKTQSLQLVPRRGFTSLAALITAVALTATLKVQAASQTWTNLPVDATWTNANNWVAKGVPGGFVSNGSTQNGDVVTFSNALSGGIGGAANPIWVDVNTNTYPAFTVITNREVGGFIFDSANCGAYVIGAPGGNNLELTAAYNNTTLGKNIYVSPTVVNPIIFNGPVHFHYASSSNGGYQMTNNAASSLATLYFAGLFNDSASSRTLTLLLAGSNTGTNTIASFSDNAGANGSVHLQKFGPGRWVLSGANDFPQKTSAGDGVPANILISEGTLEVQDPGSLGLITVANLVVTNTGILQIDGVNLNNNGISLRNGGTILMNGSGTLNNVTMGNQAATSVTLATKNPGDVLTANAITGGASDGVFHIAGPGTIVFAGDNSPTTNSTWSFDAGTNQLNNANALGATPRNLTFGASSTGVLMLNGNSLTALALTSNPTAGTPVVLNANVTPATLTVSNATANVFAGTLTDGAGGGALSLTKVGAGTLTLSGASTYTGTTTVSVGTLNVTGSLGNSAVSVASAATLAGAGTVASITNFSGGILDPGNNGVAGKLTTGSLTLNAGSINSFEFDTAPTNDQVIVTISGGLTINGGAISLYQTNGTPFAAVGTYKLIQYSGVIGGTGTGSLSIGNPQAGFAYAFGAAGGYVTVAITTSGVNATWNVDADGNWSPGSWTGGTAPHAAGDSATLGVGTSLRTVNLNVAETVGGLTFTNSNSFVVSGGNTLTVDNKGAGAPITVSAGTANAIQTPVSLNDNLTATVASGKSLAVSGNISSTSTAKTLAVNVAGTLSLSGNNSYGPAALTVGTTLTGGGTLKVGNNNALSTGDVDMTGSSTLQSGAAGLSLANNFTIESLVNATVDNNGNDLTLGGVISGAGNLVKNGAGKLTLGTANTYAGATTVNGGVLSISLDGSLGTAPGSETANSVVLNGGTLLGVGALSLSSARDIGIGSIAGSVGTNALIDATSGGTFYINGVIASAGNSGVNGLIVNSGAGNTGTVVLGGANTFNGPTYIAQGALQVANSLALQNSSLDYTNGTLLFDGGTSTATIGDLMGTQNLALTNLNGNGVALTLGGDNATMNYPANFSDAGAASIGSLTKNGTGTLTLGGTNTMGGSVSVGTGSGVSTIVIPTGGSLTCGPILPQTGGYFVVAGGTVKSTNLTSVSQGTGRGIFVSNGVASFDSMRSQSSSSGGGLDGAEILVGGGVLNAGDIALRRTANSVTVADPNSGLVVTNGQANVGTLELGTLNSSATVLVTGGGLLVTNVVTVGIQTATGSGGRGGIIGVAGGTFTVLDTATGLLMVSDAGGATFGQVGNLLLTGGTTTLGKLTFGNDAAVPAGSSSTITVNANASLYIGAGGIVKNATDANMATTFNVNGGTLGAAADLDIPTGTNAFFNVNSNGTAQPIIRAADAAGTAHDILLGGAIGGNGTLTKTGLGTLTLTNGNFFTGGVSLNAGTLNINGSWALGGALYGGLTFNGGTLQFAPAFAGNGPGDFSENTAATPVAQPVTFANNATIDVNGNTVACAYGIGNGGNGALIVQSTTPGGILNLQGANNYNGNTTVSSGTLELAQATIHASSTVTVATGAVLQLDFAGANTVNTVVLGGVTYTASGTYNNANHAPFITGTGSLVIPSTLPSYGTNLSYTVSGSTLAISWPATHLGWELAAQTNTLSTGLGNNWVTNTGTAGVTSTNLTINPANGAVFYKLVHP